MQIYDLCLTFICISTFIFIYLRLFKICVLKYEKDAYLRRRASFAYDNILCIENYLIRVLFSSSSFFFGSM